MHADMHMLLWAYVLINKILGAFPNANAFSISPRVILLHALTFDHPRSHNF